MFMYGFMILKLRKEFSNDVDSAISAFRAISVDSSFGQADLTQLFRVAAHEAKKSRAQNRILRVVSLLLIVYHLNSLAVFIFAYF